MNDLADRKPDAAKPGHLQAPDLAAAPGVRHAFFTRQGGVSDGIYATLNGGQGSSDEPDKVRANRDRMAASLGVEPAALVTVHQVHSPHCVIVDRPFAGGRPQADAMASCTPGLALAIATADCGPVLFADAGSGVIGAAHAGWKGALGGVLEATVAAMETLGAARRRVRAAIGPTLSQTNYEVGPEFEARFLAEDAGNARFFQPGTRAGYPMFDLPGYIRQQLERAEIGSIEDVALCTYADEARFFSYRRMTHRGEADYGRLIAAITLTS